MSIGNQYLFDINDPTVLDIKLIEFSEWDITNANYQAYLDAFNAAIRNGTSTTEIGDISAFLADNTGAVQVNGQWYTPNPAITSLANAALSARGTANYSSNLSSLAAALNGADFISTKQIQDGLWGEFVNAAEAQAYTDLDWSAVDTTGKSLAGLNLSGITSLSLNQLKQASSLNGANLSGINFSGKDLQNMNLAGADLSGANFDDANFAYSNLSNSNLTNVNFAGKELRWVNMAGAQITTDQLNSLAPGMYGSNLSNSNLSGFNTIGRNFIEVDFSGSNLDIEQINSANWLVGSNLSNRDLRQLEINNGKWYHAVNFAGSTINADMITKMGRMEPKLQGAIIDPASISGGTTFITPEAGHPGINGSVNVDASGNGTYTMSYIQGEISHPNAFTVTRTYTLNGWTVGNSQAAAGVSPNFSTRSRTRPDNSILYTAEGFTSPYRPYTQAWYEARAQNP